MERVADKETLTNAFISSYGSENSRFNPLLLLLKVFSNSVYRHSRTSKRCAGPQSGGRTLTHHRSGSGAQFADSQGKRPGNGGPGQGSKSSSSGASDD